MADDYAVLDAPAALLGQHEPMAIHRLPRASHFIFRGAAPEARRAGDILGVALPTAACRAESHAERAALWLGPDEWLLVGPDDWEVETSLLAGLGEAAYALVGVGHRHVSFLLDGPRAADVLNAGCPLDLDEAAFPIGMCTRTILGKVQIILWRIGAQNYTVIVWRSFAPYVLDFLTEARARL
jgi:sarcosine oxidase subunit gamma